MVQPDRDMPEETLRWEALEAEIDATRRRQRGGSEGSVNHSAPKPGDVPLSPGDPGGAEPPTVEECPACLRPFGDSPGADASEADALFRDSPLKSKTARRMLCDLVVSDRRRLRELRERETAGELNADVARSLNSLSRAIQRGLEMLGLVEHATPAAWPDETPGEPPVPSARPEPTLEDL